MKAKFTAFGFLSGFRNVGREALLMGRYSIPVAPALRAGVSTSETFNPGDFVPRRLDFNLVGFDDDNCAIFELADF